jgi:hypothetical protein
MTEIQIRTSSEGVTSAFGHLTDVGILVNGRFAPKAAIPAKAGFWHL